MDDVAHLITRVLIVLIHTLCGFLTTYGIAFFFIQRYRRGIPVKQSIFSFHLLIHCLLIAYHFLQVFRGIVGSINSVDTKLDLFPINLSTFFYYLKDGVLMLIIGSCVWSLLRLYYDQNENATKIVNIVSGCFAVLIVLSAFLHAIVKVSTNFIGGRNRLVGDAEYHQSDPFFEVSMFLFLMACFVLIIIAGVGVYRNKYNSLRYNVTIVCLLEVILMLSIHRVCFFLVIMQQYAHLLSEFVSIFNRICAILLTFWVLLGLLDQNGFAPDETHDGVTLQ
jgi:hypothetical protein